MTSLQCLVVVLLLSASHVLGIKVRRPDIHDDFSLHEGQLMTESSPMVFYDNLSLFGKSKLEIVNPQEVTIDEAFYNEGLFYQKCNGKRPSDEPSTTSFSGSSHLKNIGIFLYDFRAAEVAPIFKMGKASQFSNSGEMWFLIGGKERKTAPTGPGKSRFNSDFDVDLSLGLFFQNFGTMTFMGTESYKVLVNLAFTGKRPTVGKGLVNYGKVCLKNTVLQAKVNIRGRGCVTIGESSELTIHDRGIYPEYHSFYMDPGASFSMLHIEVTGKVASFSAKIEGFGKQCFINFSKNMMEWTFLPKEGAIVMWSRDLLVTHKLVVGGQFVKDDFLFDGQILTVRSDTRGPVREECACSYDFEEITTR